MSLLKHTENLQKETKEEQNTDTDGSLKINDIRARSSVSMDHFESILKFRTYMYFGGTTS